jgi:hypothetical protein
VLKSFIFESMNNWTRKLKIVAYFLENPSTDIVPDFKIIYGKQKRWNPTANSQKLKQIFYQLDQSTISKKMAFMDRTIFLHKRFGLSRLDELILDTLRSLKQRDDIIIKPADKNLGLVVMEKSFYHKLVVDSITNSIPQSISVIDSSYTSILRYLCDRIFSNVCNVKISSYLMG